jgi:hypothetical protein
MVNNMAWVMAWQGLASEKAAFGKPSVPTPKGGQMRRIALFGSIALWKSDPFSDPAPRFWSSKCSFKTDLKSLAGIYWLEKAAQATSLVLYP